MRPQDRLAVIQRCVVHEMARLGQEFRVDGSVVRGPGSTAVAVREHLDAGGTAHVDLGFVLRLGHGDGPVVWDCAAGLGRTEQEQLENAVRMWATTTAATVVELLGAGDGGSEAEGRERGEACEHHRHHGLPGLRAVQGPAAVFGFGHERLAAWLADHQVVSALAEALRPELAAQELNGVKLFLGGKAGDDVAEVRINGEVSGAASAALRALDWPRGERLCWARLFVLLVAEGGGAPTPAQPTALPAPTGPAAPQRGLLGRCWEALRERAG